MLFWFIAVVAAVVDAAVVDAAVVDAAVVVAVVDAAVVAVLVSLLFWFIAIGQLQNGEN